MLTSLGFVDMRLNSLIIFLEEYLFVEGKQMKTGTLLGIHYDGRKWKKRLLARYTLHGHKLRFFKELKAQSEQRIEISLVSGHSFIQAL